MNTMTQSNMHLILRLEINKNHNSFGEIATIISDSKGDLTAIDVIKEGAETTIRDLTIKVSNKEDQETMVQSINDLDGVTIQHISDRTFLVHLGGKIEVRPTLSIDNREELSHVYTPEVARVCKAIDEDPSLAHNLTIKRNAVAVISDGSAVLGLGKLKPEAAMPVMEGKAMLFKQLADINAYPLCLDEENAENIIQIVKSLSPSFGGINLEDISSPRCFEIEERLKEELDIPVFHDDQHGTAIVVLAGVINALKLVKKDLKQCKIVVCGIGAAGISITKMLLKAGAENIIGVDKEGAITKEEHYENPMWTWYGENTNPNRETGPLPTVIQDADIFIGVAAANILQVEDIKKMAEDPIVFALANPDPEIAPEVANPYVRVMATGRSDFPNQVNNVLCFPGIFRGALDCKASTINDEMKLAASKAIADVIPEDELNEDYIIPGVFNKNVVPKIKEAVVEAAYATGVARNKKDI
ncbi:NAD-dependent malic enzyme [Halobacillus dabanensis]|nr:NAD-dependent malic enzyme [Halobacillus dabanensis]